MDPARLIPAAEAIPSPWGWFEALLWLTFALHLLFMNLAVGSAALALAGRLGRRQEDLARELGHRLPTFLALTVNFGVAPLLFVQVVYGQFLYTSSVLMAGWWLAVIGLVILGYYASYAHDAKFTSAPGLSRLALALALGLLAAVGFLFANNMTLMLRPEAWTAYFHSPGGGLLNLSDPTMWPRAAHFLLAAPAVAGLYAAIIGQKKRRTDWTACGLAWFTRVTMLQIVVGGWLLFSLPRNVMLGFMGGSGLATALLALGVLVGLSALLAGIQKKPTPAAWLTFAAIVLMAGARAQVRLLTLAPVFTPASLPVTNETGSLVMFLAALAVGLALIGWMLKTYAKTAGRG
jgi:hypothetical protein